MAEFQHLGFFKVFTVVTRRDGTAQHQVLRVATNASKSRLFWDTKHLYFCTLTLPLLNDASYFTKRTVRAITEYAAQLGMEPQVVMMDRKEKVCSTHFMFALWLRMLRTKNIDFGEMTTSISKLIDTMWTTFVPKDTMLYFDGIYLDITDAKVDMFGQLGRDFVATYQRPK